MTDEVPIDVVIDSLKHHKENGKETLRLWRRSSEEVKGEYVHYSEWNLPPIPTKILHEYECDLE